MQDELADRYRAVAAGFTARVQAVPEDRWDAPSPCEGWTTRDVVAHLVEWLPAFFFERWEVDAVDGPSAADDPVGAWAAFDATLQGALEDPAIADAERETPMGSQTFAQAFDQIGLPDVLIHTWDVARAAGLDETLDAAEVARMAPMISPEVSQTMVASGHYGEPVEVPDDADGQTRLLAFMGRRP